MKLTPYQRAERMAATAMSRRPHYYVGKRKESVRKAVKLNTVNVIEIIDNDLQSIRSFADTPEGNKRAEKLFLRCVKENSTFGNALPKDTATDLLDDGVFTDDTYTVLITHSI